MYGKTSLTQEQLCTFNEPSNSNIIEFWKNSADALSFFEYNEETEIWYFAITLLSENYNEMLPGIAFLKSIDGFIAEHEDNFSLIYDYFWSNQEINAYIQYHHNKAELIHHVKNISEIPDRHLKYAEDFLSNRLSTLGY